MNSSGASSKQWFQIWFIAAQPIGNVSDDIFGTGFRNPVKNLFALG
jgi:hypothetical protein